jgi:NADP-dependent 3-hydroxy acid dehydrogenase YdfG
MEATEMAGAVAVIRTRPRTVTIRNITILPASLYI